MGILQHLSRPLFIAGLGAGAYSFSHSPASTTSFHHHSRLLPQILFAGQSSVSSLAMSTTTASSSTTSVPSWSDLAKESAATPVGKALNTEVSLRKEGKGSAARENTLRKFGRQGEPVVTLYRYVKNTTSRHVNGIPIS